MVVQSGDKAVSNAKAYTHCDPGYCLKYTRTWLEIGSREPSAIEAWRNAKRKHPGDQKPPRGAPVFWDIGQYGHIALALDNDTGRSTDTPSSGRVGTEGGNWWKNNWGAKYLGWTEDLNGVSIPYLSKSKWAGGDVYVSKLHKGQQDSDSVARLCYRLMHHKSMPGSHRPPKQVRNYNQELLEAVRYWQRNINGSGDSKPAKGPTDGTSMSNAQANRLFGDPYTVHPK